MLGGLPIATENHRYIVHSDKTLTASWYVGNLLAHDSLVSGQNQTHFGYGFIWLSTDYDAGAFVSTSHLLIVNSALDMNGYGNNMAVEGSVENKNESKAYVLSASSSSS